MKNIENLTTPTRERTSVPISGLDLSTPDDLVQDGKCETLHNMRYEAEAWRPVHPYMNNIDISNIPKPPFAPIFTVVYHHPAAGENSYIVRTINTSYPASTYNYYISDYNTKTYTTIVGNIKEQKISHFGNVLIFTEGVATRFFIYEGAAYKEVSPNLPLPTITITQDNSTPYKHDYKYFSLDKQFFWSTNTPLRPNCLYSEANYPIGDLLEKIRSHSTGAEFVVTTYRNIYNIDKDTMPPSKQDNQIYGNLCLIVAYRMSDGTIIQSSPLHLITRDTDNKPYNIAKVTRGDLEESTGLESNQGAYDKCLWAVSNPVAVSKTVNTDLDDSSPEFCPIYYRDISLEIKIPNDVIADNSIVSSVALYCTRLTPPFKYENYRNITENSSTSILDIYNTTDFLNSPFYLLKEYDKKNITDNAIKLDITPEMLEDMLQNERYKPSVQNILSPSATYDYNNRLHLAAPYIDYLASPHLSISTWFIKGDSSDLGKSRRIGVSVNYDGQTKYICSPNFSTVTYLNAPYKSIISIPDTSVKAFLSQIKTEKSVEKLVSMPTNYAYGIGYAYYIKPPTEKYQFPPIEIPDVGTIDESLIQSAVIPQPNRLQVSETNNCFSLPYDLSYRIGSESNRIIALQSAALEMSDAKFGEFPLYVFTTEGVFAMQAGETTLYSNIIPINYDKIINPNTLAINGAVVYITEKGVHMLSNQGSQVVSTPIHDSTNRPPLEFLRTCQLIYPKEHNEFILLNNNYTGDDMKGKAYVFNLDAGYWSTRDLSGTKLNTDELVDSKYVYDLSNEDENKALSIDIATRPIKLGNVEFKRLETIIPRMRTTNDSIELGVSLEASNDGYTYANLYKTDNPLSFSKNINNPLVIRRVPFSAKYFKLQLNVVGANEDYFATSITHIDFEWYRRFSRRMR
jgi:hypothetical protein